MADGVNISVALDEKALSDWEKTAKVLGKPGQFKKALAQAINRTLAATRTQAKREISQRFTIKQKSVAGFIKESRATPGKLTADLQFIGPGIPAIRFKVKPPDTRPAQRPTISIQYKKDGGGPVPGKFVAMMKSGHVGVFERVEGSSMRANPKRQAIAEIMGPSAAGMVGGEEARNAIQERAGEVLAERIDHEMRRLLK